MGRPANMCMQVRAQRKRRVVKPSRRRVGDRTGWNYNHPRGVVSVLGQETSTRFQYWPSGRGDREHCAVFALANACLRCHMAAGRWMRSLLLPHRLTLMGFLTHVNQVSHDASATIIPDTWRFRKGMGASWVTKTPVKCKTNELTARNSHAKEGCWLGKCTCQCRCTRDSGLL